MRFSTSFATAWFWCCLLRCSLWGPPLRFLSHTTPDSEPQENTTCSRFCNTFLARRHRTHISLCSGRLGGWSHSQWRQEPCTGDAQKDPQRGVQSLPHESSVLPSGTCHPGRAQIQPSPRGRARHSTVGDRKLSPPHCKLPRATQGGDLCSDSADQTWHIPNCFQEPGHGHRAPRLQLHPGAFRAQAPGALHKTLDKQQHKQDQKLLTHHKAAEELTPAFSFSSVCISVKYIIYSSIGLIVIYYSLELLLSFPYFNHIYASNFAYRSYCLEFIIEIHRIKLKQFSQRLIILVFYIKRIKVTK